MNQVWQKVPAVSPLYSAKLQSWIEWSRQRLYAYRPRFQNWHFWMIQGLVIFIAVFHSMTEAPGVLHDLGVPSMVPTTLFLVPVIYAALAFGFVGAVTTALWATLLAIPNWIIWHRGWELFGCMFQMAVVNTVAFLVGQQVERERSARQRVEATTTELKASRMRYRSLFESNPMAILVLNSTGVVLEANPMASILFDRNRSTIEGMLVTDLLGPAGSDKLLGSSNRGNWQTDLLLYKLKNGAELYLEPMLTEVSDGQGNPIIQVLFRDATEEHGRQAERKTYTTYVIRAQEEERQRIARELYDGTIQSLVLLCRRLDSMNDKGELLPSSVTDRLQEARVTAEEAVSELRDVTKALRPPILDDLGMVTSIIRLLDDFEERSGTKGQQKVVGQQRRLPSDTELGIFRIAQEALRNVERHAKATRVTVTITFRQQEVRLEVADNGVGFLVSSVLGDLITSGQHGLLSMRERAELLSGKFEIQSGSGGGTRVMVSIPVAGDIPLTPAGR